MLSGPSKPQQLLDFQPGGESSLVQQTLPPTAPKTQPLTSPRQVRLAGPSSLGVPDRGCSISARQSRYPRKAPEAPAEFPRFLYYMRRVWAHEISFFVPRTRDTAYPAQGRLSPCLGFAQACSPLLRLNIIFGTLCRSMLN